MQSYISQAQT